MEDSMLCELYFLISKFLDGGPCTKAATAIKEEIEKYKLLPKRIDWSGNCHQLDFRTFETRNLHIRNDFLLRVVSRIGGLLNQHIPSSVNTVNSLLGSGSQSLLRTSSDIIHNNETHFLFARINNAPLKPSIKRIHYHPHNIVNVLNARESCGPGPITSTLPTQLYEKFIRCRRLLGHLSCVYCVSFDRTGRFIFTGADDMLIKIWSAEDGRLLATLRGHAAEITDITVNYENTLLAAGSCDKMIRVWCIKTTQPVCVLTGHTGMITSVRFCPYSKKDDRYLVSTSNDGTVCFWSWNVKTREFNPKPIKYVERIKQGAQMICFSFSSGGSFLAVGSSDHYVRVYHVSGPAGPAKVLEMQPHFDQVDSLQFSNLGLRFVSGSKDGTANIWKYERQEWHNQTLQMSECLPGQQVPENAEVKTKLKVTMVGWSLDDAYVITAVNDHSIKVWESCSGKLKYVLREHDDEVFVIEAHPKDPRIFLSGGHDGRVFLWDLTVGKHIKMFFNQITGQGYGSIFDCKWSPDGYMFACTDSHGHLTIFGFGDSERYKKVPDEVFFHTDYRPLIRDANHYVIDEQTQCAPHLMAPPFLVDIDGNPYPPALQRLVPGRENCKDDQLVPYIAIQNERGVAEVLEPGQEQPPPVPPSQQLPASPSVDGQRPTIDDMIERLQQEQARHRVNEEHRYAANLNELAANTLNRQRSQSASEPSNNRPGIRRSGDVEGVRQSSGNWQSRDNTNSLRGVRRYVVPLSISMLQTIYNQILKCSEIEEVTYSRECKKKPIPMASVAKELSNKERLTRRKKRMILQRQGIRNNTRSATRAEEMEVDVTDESDTSFSAAGAESWQESSSNTDNDSDDSSDDDWQFSRSDPRSSRTKRKSQRTRNIVESESESETRQNRSSEINSHNSDEPSTSTGLKKVVKKENKKKTKLNNEDVKSITDLPEAYKPPEWLTEVVPKRTPYFPQIGDEVIYFRKGHELYIDAVKRSKLYNIHPKTQPLYNKNVKDQQLVKVLDINYEVRPPRLVILKMAIINESTNEETGETFTLKYHDMPDVIDFLVLKQHFDISIQREWKPNDRFRSIIDNRWWFGTIKSIEIDENYKDSPFQIYKVVWDSKDEENMSSWDLEPCTDRIPENIKEGLSITEEEREQLMYIPKSSDWPECGRDMECNRLIHGLENIMQIAWAEYFIAPVDLNEYPDYAMIIAYPIDLSTIKARLENRFYRSLDAVLFDVEFIETNARVYNKPHSLISRNGKLVTALCKEFIRRTYCEDPTEIQQEIHQNKSMYESTESENDDHDTEERIVTRRKAQDNLANNRKKPNWVTDCKQLLNELFRNVDSEPFRNAVSLDEYPDYLETVSTPMDLSTIKEQLYTGCYSHPKEMHRDLKIIFQNSKSYNTNKRSIIYTMTLRLQSLVTEKMKNILNNYKQAMTDSLKTSKRQSKMVNGKGSKNNTTFLQPSTSGSSSRTTVISSNLNGHDTRFRSSLRKIKNEENSDDQPRPSNSNGTSKHNSKNNFESDDTDDDYQPSINTNKKVLFKAQQPVRSSTRYRKSVVRSASETELEEDEEDLSSLVEEDEEEETEVDEEETEDGSEVEEENEVILRKNKGGIKRKKIGNQNVQIKKTKFNDGNNRNKNRRESITSVSTESSESENNSSFILTDSSITDAEPISLRKSSKSSRKNKKGSKDKFSPRKTRRRHVNYNENNGSDYEYELCGAESVSSRGRVRKFKGQPRALRSH